MVCSTSTLMASVVSAALAGAALGLVLGARRVSTCPKEGAAHGVMRRFTCLLCRKKKKGFPSG